ncbi:MAG: tryptophan--tRNA ligase [Candidatus Shikimatogenerans sp. Tcar]|uniref:tryptophan--tRNA ligase n=1 Tax=Candidatus Shikimatogenerans sp. Tcar TaxID=3158565 RepID=A0AAU7QTM7_9FLAO
MKIILLGIKNNGSLHIGHLLSIIYPSINFLKNNKKYILLILIADLHVLTYINNIDYNKKKYNNYIYKILSIFLSLEINIKKVLIYKQSDIKYILKIFWYLCNLYKFNRLKLTHIYKKYLNNINIGEFIYPILMASDIISLNVKYIFIGKDQKQHLEISKYLIKKINIKLLNYKFNIPKSFINKKFNKVLGLDFKKMSKSNKNTINIFSNKKKIKNKIFKIKTSSKKLQNINIKKIYIYYIYKYLFKNNKKKFLKQCKNYKYNFYKIKKNIYKKILKVYKNERLRYFYYYKKKKLLKNILLKNKYIINKIVYKNYNIINNIFK